MSYCQSQPKIFTLGKEIIIFESEKKCIRLKNFILTNYTLNQSIDGPLEFDFGGVSENIDVIDKPIDIRDLLIKSLYEDIK